MSGVISQNQATGAYPPLEFDVFDAPRAQPAAPASPATPAPGGEAPVEATDGALEIAPGVSLPTLEDIERITSEAHREGYSAGYDEGAARGRAESGEIQLLLQGMDAALGSLDEQVSAQIQGLAIEIARQIVRDTLAVKPEVIQLVVREALQALPQQAAVIQAHPADVQLLRRYLEQQFDGVAHRVVENDAMQRGGCLIESAGAQIDAQIGTRWRRVVEHLSRTASGYDET